ncbi:MAG: RHS repeat-associated core domain-containing protein [Oscillospiraceae bacterium]
MMRTTVSTQPQIIIVACCITLRRSAYGAWGNYSVHDDKGAKITKASFIGHINPLRYRGYYYDRETRLYYLQSRYYDFANCRFINADTFATTDANGFLSANMFAYCENNLDKQQRSNGQTLAWCYAGWCGCWSAV